jgi:phage-related minor tail protein
MWRAAAWLIFPMGAMLFSLSMRQYHRFRSAIQGLIEGSRAKQEKADRDAKDAQAKAATESQVSKSIDALTKAVNSQVDAVTTAIKEQIATLTTSINAQGETVKNMNDRLLSASATLQGLSSTVTSLDHRLLEIEEKISLYQEDEADEGRGVPSEEILDRIRRRMQSGRGRRRGRRREQESLGMEEAPPPTEGLEE